MSKHMTIINLACTITKLRKWGEAWKHSAESAQAATARMHQAHEAKMVEHRAAFGARTEADRRIIEGLRAEIVAERMAMQRDSLMSERDGLLTQVQDMRAEIERLRIEAAKCKAARDDLYQREGIEQKRRMDVEDERDALRAEGAELKTQLERLTSWAAKNQAARETLQNEIERLKSQSKAPKYKVGDKLEPRNRSLGQAITIVGVRTVYDCQIEGAEYAVGHSEAELNKRYEQTPPEATHAEPDLTQLHAKGKDAWSDVPNATQWVEEMRGNSEATHDTEAGKAAAESAAHSAEIDIGTRSRKVTT